MPLEVEVPSYVSEAARRGLDWHKEGKSGDGVTEQTLREARDMVAGRISKDKVRRMGPWFRRHEPDMSAPKNKSDSKDFPGAGAVAWALWGGPTSGDIMRARDWAERKAAQLDEEDKKASAVAAAISQNTTMPRIITDIDGTIMDASGRPITRVLDYIKAEAEEVVVLTNRPESERAKTVADLKRIGLQYQQLIMNKDGKPAPEYKAGAVKAMLDAGLEVDEFIDNDAANREAVAALGVEVLDPADIVAGEEDDDEEEASAFDHSAKIKKTMSKLTPEAELNDLRVAAAALLTERDDLRATVEKLTVGAADELTAAKAELSAKDARIGELTAEVAALAEKVAALELTHVSAAKQAADIVASTGTTPVAAEKQEAPALTVEQIKEQYASMPAGNERVAFLQKHKAAILFGRLK